MTYLDKKIVDENIHGRKIIRENKNNNLKKKRQKSYVLVWLTLVIFTLGVSTGYLVKPNHYQNEESLIKKDLKLYGEDVRAAPIIFDNFEAQVIEFKPLDVPLDTDIQEFIFNLSVSYGIDFELVMGLIETESSFRTNIESSTNDFGLMQINECNHDWLSEELGITNFNDPYENVRAGLYVLRGLFDKYGDNTHKVLMAYNMGSSGANRLWSKGVIETPYSVKVISNANKFRKELSNGK